MIVVLLLILILFVGIYKLIAISSIKVAVFAIDFFLVFFYTIYYLHGLVSVRISSGNVVYFWDCVFGIIAVAIYSFIILTIHHFFTKMNSSFLDVIYTISILKIYQKEFVYI